LCIWLTLRRGKRVEDAADRLVDLLGMGRQYKVLGVVAKGMGEEGQDVGEV
jgi:NADH dehydrogenase [ubiquinone] 1 alpha subcomplex assembly factor 7